MRQAPHATAGRLTAGALGVRSCMAYAWQRSAPGSSWMRRAMVGAAKPKYSGPDTDGRPARGPGGGSPRAASISARRAATWRTTAVHGADAVGPALRV